MAPVGVAAAWGTSLEGRCVSPRKGGARLFLTNGMAREATRELGGWRPQGVTERVDNKTCSEEVAPEMGVASDWECATLSVEEFVKDLELEVSRDDEVVDTPRSRYLRIRFRGFRTPKGYLVPGAAQPTCSNFLGGMGQRVRPSGLSEMRKRAVLRWGTEYRALSRRHRETEEAAAAFTSERDSVRRNHHGAQSQSPGAGHRR